MQNWFSILQKVLFSKKILLCLNLSCIFSSVSLFGHFIWIQFTGLLCCAEINTIVILISPTYKLNLISVIFRSLNHPFPLVKFSVLDPDPHGSALRWPPWIRIRSIDADSGSGSSSYELTKIFWNISLTYRYFAGISQV